ncbi:putative E3 ubiquitin-protein ligase ARI16 [Raphanus sativus]|nr:putative E3 ubiquitin-protein ligase ARI16 [Raphanus sativus]
MKKSKRDLKAIKEVTTDCGLGGLDMAALRQAWTLIVQCRSVLKWSCVFGYFITDYHSAKKDYLDHIREKATAQLLKHKETLDEVTDRVISGGGDIIAFRQKLEVTTTTTGNYFQCFIKTLEDGLCDVKVDTYVDGTTDYWFCDRCTYKNYSFERECRICVAPCESPSHVALAQGGTNPLELDDESS